MTFNEHVTVNTNNGTPQIAVKIGEKEVQAAYTSGSDSNKLIFRYTVVVGDVDNNGIELRTNMLDLNGGIIKDAAGNNRKVNGTISSGGVSK